ncbi:hypothetical protein FUAX_02040 [Fulvitalea axinellae]|uniref:Uncharacterized protein n=1 Tax=Fulvitalea axinellae TaxID=1182444 RepID=A0AAU9CLN6_9BACT|nr:hypothetical protein FUAX_02040 [Fulvitalea axinellae]
MNNRKSLFSQFIVCCAGAYLLWLFGAINLHNKVSLYAVIPLVFLSIFLTLFRLVRSYFQ